jgi:hypothetical protein
MTPTSYRNPFLILCAVSLLLAGLLGKGFWDHAWLVMHVAMADEQIAIFDEMRTQAERSDPAKATDCLGYVVNYYPSGSKQDKGSRLDKIVESARAHAVAAIIADLRKRSGKDLGDDPQRWIDDFATKR